MRKLLLIGASMAVLAAAPAWANRDDDGSGQGPGPSSNPTFDISVAAALAGNSGGVAGNHALSESQNTSTSIDGSYIGSKGVSNQNQNAGANSALQNALALSYIQGCQCASGPAAGATLAFGAVLAVAGNGGEVEGNSSVNTQEKTITPNWWGGPTVTVGKGSNVTASISGSYNYDTGVFQVNQNSGANSLLQNSSAVAAADGLQGKVDLGLAVALAGNSGEVARNRSFDDHAYVSGSISNSFNNDKGMINANQNVGANSQLQNASALASLKFCGCAADNVSLTIAAAGNDGGVWRNSAHTENGSNGASMASSFNSSQGMMQANQNAGANSLLQNSVAVGVIRH